MSIQEQRRKAFEEYWSQMCREFPGTTEYQAMTIWNAALDSVCVTLPDAARRSTGDLDERYNAGHLRNEIIEAIHAAGVKTK